VRKAHVGKDEQTTLKSQTLRNREVEKSGIMTKASVSRGTIVRKIGERILEGKIASIGKQKSRNCV